ncbi:N-acetylmuramoyl-L-alanine amidase [Clostridium sp. KNHs214]|uniref:N-acetylmuramoyl-L-alanine amidase n=1 Tax=Clostridium sp. KNHs214 TaxID=1540257 RepID=UPI00068BE005|nr:N-acetylmuramoyl-L-alanine amidase [Clostridium sp. KNHs214]
MCTKKRRFHVLGTIVMVMFLLLGFNFNVKAVEANNLTSIMGQAKLTKYQALEYFKSYNSNKDLKYAEDFISTVWEEGIVEGVRPDIAFVQMMKETNFLKFTGDVKEQQNNFAGIGATGNGEPGSSFPDMRTGIRCVIQHLKAYASKEPLKQACVDPRFQYVQKGVAPYVEWLAIGSNPNYPGGWASDPQYGSSIVDMLSCAAKLPEGDCKATIQGLEVSLNGVKVSNGTLQAGKNYTIKSQGKSGNGVLYQFWIKDLSINSWSRIKDYSTTDTVTWTPKKDGKYLVGVHVRDKYSKNSGADDFRYDNYSVIGTEGVVENLEVSLNGVKVSNRTLQAGKNYTIKSQGKSGNGVLYQFWIKDLSINSWSRIKDYSTTDTVTWTPKKDGKYLVGVHVRDKYSKNSGADDFRYDNYSVIGTEGVVENLEVSLNGVKVSNRTLQAGKNYTIKSQGKSGNGVLYQFWIKDLSINSWSRIKDYSTTDTVTWTPKKDGKYLVGVHVRDKYSKNSGADDFRYDEYSVIGSKGVVENLEVSLNGVKVSNRTLQAGKNYTIKSQGKSGNGVLYQFWIKDLSINSWSRIKDYSTTDTVTWTPKKDGKYLVGVHVRDKYSKNSGADDFRYDEYSVIGSKGVVENLEVSLNGVKVSNRTLQAGKNYTIKSQGKSGNGVLYQFWIKDLSINSWSRIKDYSTTDTVTWTPKKDGKYLVGVHVRDKYSKNSGADDFRYDNYSVIGTEGVVENLEVSLNGVKVNNGKLNEGKNYTIKSEGTSANGVLYQFWIKDLSINSWSRIKDYSTTDTVTWTPKKDGKYLVGVHVRDKYSKNSGADDFRYDEYSVIGFKGVVDNLEVSLNGVKVNNGKLNEGKKYTIKSEGTSANGVLYQFWIKDLSTNSWSRIKDYSTTDTVTWTPNKGGKYLVGVHVRDKYSKNSGADDFRYDQYTVIGSNGIVENLEVSLNGVKVSNGKLNEGKKYTIKSQGISTNGVLYQFWIKDLSTNSWSRIKDYSTTDTVTWTPNKGGKYLVGVHVRDKYSKNSGADDFRYDQYTVIGSNGIVENLVVSLNGVKVSNRILQAGKNYTIKSEGISVNGVLYQFWIKDLSTNSWSRIKDYSTTDTVTWTPSKGGKYLVGVHVRDKQSKNSGADDFRYDEYSVEGGITIVLDAGHGGKDPGAISSANTGRITEADLNQRLTLKLGKILEAYGYNVIYTRAHIPSTYNTVAQDLENRVAVANNAKANLFISIHHDSSDATSANGVSTHYSSYRPRLDNSGIYDVGDIKYDRTPCDAAVKSKQLSQEILNNLVSLGFNSRGSQDHNLYVTKNTTMPSVLVEAGFMSNDSEVRKVSDSSMETKIAQKIADAIRLIFK